VVESRTVAEPKASEAKASDPKVADPLTNLVKATSAAPATTSTVLRPPASIPVSHSDSGLSPGGSRRIAAVQRALTEYGYGQLKPTGTIGADTQAAIQKFERDRKVPVTGQVTDRLVRELSTMIGHPVE
jgi:peptidoglycan hydrolase-like protein with peptidoglycan-binding domain